MYIKSSSYNFTCQLYLNKAGGEKKVSHVSIYWKSLILHIAPIFSKLKNDSTPVRTNSSYVKNLQAFVITHHSDLQDTGIILKHILEINLPFKSQDQGS